MPYTTYFLYLCYVSCVFFLISFSFKAHYNLVCLPLSCHLFSYNWLLLFHWALYHVTEII